MKRPVTAGRVTGAGSNLILVGALADQGRPVGQVIVDYGDEIDALRVLFLARKCSLSSSTRSSASASRAT